MRVFLDANILFSVAKSDGAVRALVRLLLDRRHECWVDAYVVAEARRNLVSKGSQAMQLLDFGSAYGPKVGGVTIHSPRALAETVPA